jgi:putative ABC transport system substrate-binding protein
MHRIWAKQATIGFLGATTPSVWSAFVAAFEQKLHELGWVDGLNIAIDYQWAHGDENAYARLAKGFVSREVDVIVTSGTGPVSAAITATKKNPIPIVFAAAGDPVRTNLVASLKKPGRNVTGLSNGQTNLGVKRLNELVKVVRNLRRLAILGNFDSPNIPLEADQVESRARQLKIKTVRCPVQQASQLTPTIMKLKGQADALYVCTEPFVTTNSVAINIAAAAAGLPTMHAFRDYTEAGGLMSFGPDFRAMFGRAAEIVDRVLQGTNPADIAVEEQTDVELVINQSTANALGLTIPKGVRGRATVVR